MNTLKFWRIERGLSQLELAQASGVGRWAIQLAETGIRPLEPAERERLSNTLGIALRSLEGLEGRLNANEANLRADAGLGK